MALCSGVTSFASLDADACGLTVRTWYLEGDLGNRLNSFRKKWLCKARTQLDQLCHAWYNSTRLTWVYLPDLIYVTSRLNFFRFVSKRNNYLILSSTVSYPSLNCSLVLFIFKYFLDNSIFLSLEYILDYFYKSIASSLGQTNCPLPNIHRISRDLLIFCWGLFSTFHVQIYLSTASLVNLIIMNNSGSFSIKR